MENIKKEIFASSFNILRLRLKKIKQFILNQRQEQPKCTTNKNNENKNEMVFNVAHK